MRRSPSAPAFVVPRPAALIVLALGVLLAYAGTLRDGFVHDDRPEILDNPFVHDLHHVREIFTRPSWGFARLAGRTPGEHGYRGESNYYRPLQYLAYAVLYRLFGPSPVAFHAFKLLLHLATTALFFGLVGRHDERLAFPGALLFAVHPELSEAVSWISAVTDAAAGLLFVASLLAYLRWRRTRTVLAMIGLCTCFLAALLTKETTIVLLVFLPAYQRVWERAWPPPSDWRRLYLTLGGLAAFSLVLRYRALGGLLVPGRERHGFLGGAQVLLNQLVLLSSYLEAFLLPRRLNAFHVFHPVLALGDGRVWLAAVTVGSVGALAVLVHRLLGDSESRLFVIGLMWAAATLAPPILLFQRIGENVFAERYLYLPWLGLSLSAAAALCPLLQRGPRLGLAFLALLAALGIWRIRQREPAWHDPIAFYEDVLRQSPDGSLWQSLGDAYADAGRYEEAVGAYRTMLEREPANYETYSNLGIAYDQMGRVADAAAAFERSVAIRPNEVALSNLGIAYHELGRYDDALAAYRRSIALRPTARAYFNLGTTYYLGLRRYAEAIAAYEEALRLDPEAPATRAALEEVRRKSLGPR